jgi:hypothetical protein
VRLKFEEKMETGRRENRQDMKTLGGKVMGVGGRRSKTLTVAVSYSKTEQSVIRIELLRRISKL